MSKKLLMATLLSSVFAASLPAVALAAQPQPVQQGSQQASHAKLTAEQQKKEKSKVQAEPGNAANTHAADSKAK